MDECENKVIKPYKLTAFEDDDFLNIRTNMDKLHYDNEWKNKKGKYFVCQKSKIECFKILVGLQIQFEKWTFPIAIMEATCSH